MSRKRPGVLFDASNSWNGYNHQGKLALFYAIDQMTNLIDSAASDNDNRQKLSTHFVEIEHLEDFSIGTVENGKLHYTSVHQVKDMEAQYVSSYKSALQGLAKHLIDDPEIKNAYLHVTKQIKPGRKPFSEQLGGMIDSFNYPGATIREIEENRKDPDFRKKLLSDEKTLAMLRQELRYALEPVNGEPPALTQDNLDDAFDRCLNELRPLIPNRETLKQTYKTKILLFRYQFEGEPQLFCKEDQAAALVCQSIEKFYQKRFPDSYQNFEEHLQNAYIYLISQLDNHVVQRARFFSEYKKGYRRRYILYSELYDWLLSDKIGNPGKSVYLYHVREYYFRIMNRVCRHCRRSGSATSDAEFKCREACRIPQFMHKLRTMNEEQMEDLIHSMFPDVDTEINLKTYPELLQKEQLKDPFLEGLQRIGMPFDEDDSQAGIVYRDSDNQQCILTALARFYHDDEEEDPEICQRIMENRQVHKFLMDYRFLISRDVEVDSIQEACPSISLDYLGTDNPELEDEHILGIGKVGIVCLEKFISNLPQEDDNT